MMGWMGPLTASLCHSWVAEDPLEGESSMEKVSTIGVDIAKNGYLRRLRFNGTTVLITRLENFRARPAAA